MKLLWTGGFFCCMKIVIKKEKLIEKTSIIIGIILIVWGGFLFFKKDEVAQSVEVNSNYEETYEDFKNTPKPTEIKKASDKKINYLHADTIIEGKTISLKFTAGDTLLDSLTIAKNEGILFFRGKEFSGLGTMVEEINGKKAENGYSWIYYINGKEATVGVSSYILKEGDVIEWKYEKNY